MWIGEEAAAAAGCAGANTCYPRGKGGPARPTGVGTRGHFSLWTILQLQNLVRYEPAFELHTMVNSSQEWHPLIHTYNQESSPQSRLAMISSHPKKSCVLPQCRVSSSHQHPPFRPYISITALKAPLVDDCQPRRLKFKVMSVWI